MNKEQVQQIIAAHFAKYSKTATVTVSGDGGKFEATVVSDSFGGLNTLNRHQSVYAAIKNELADGTIHALSIRAYTPEEMEAV